jgi:hypothetical protein
MRVRIKGWSPRLDPVELTKTMQTLLGFSSTDAEHLTDLVLEGEPLELNLPPPTAAEFFRHIRRLGVIAEMSAN